MHWSLQYMELPHKSLSKRLTFKILNHLPHPICWIDKPVITTPVKPSIPKVPWYDQYYAKDIKVLSRRLYSFLYMPGKDL